MNEEQLLADLYKRFQAGEITYDTFLAEQNRIRTEVAFLGDFNNEIGRLPFRGQTQPPTYTPFDAEQYNILAKSKDPEFMQTPFDTRSPNPMRPDKMWLKDPNLYENILKNDIKDYEENSKLYSKEEVENLKKDLAEFQKNPREFLRKDRLKYSDGDAQYYSKLDRAGNNVWAYSNIDKKGLDTGDEVSTKIGLYDYFYNREKHDDYMGYSNNPFMNQINMDNANDFMQEGVGRLPLKPLEQIVSKEGKQPWETMSEADLKAYEESLNIPQVNEEQVIGWMDRNYAPNPQEGVRPQNMEELKKAYAEGRLTRDAYNQMFDEFSTKEEPNKNMLLQDAFSQYLPFMNPYGTDIGTELYSLGKFIGTKPGTQGKGLGIASSALAAGLGGARTLLSGLAQQKQTEKTAEEIRRQLAQRHYTPQTQYLNQNNRGGSTES